MTIHNDEEWIAFCKSRYPGSPNWKPDKKPKVYPCEAGMGHVDGGLGGDYTSFEIRYKTSLPHAPYTPWETILQA